MTTKYPSNKAGQVPTRGGSRSARRSLPWRPGNIGQFATGSPNPSPRKPLPVQRPAAPGTPGAPLLPGGGYEPVPKNPLIPGYARPLQDMRKAASFGRALRGPMMRKLQWLDAAKAVAQALDRLDQWSDSWWQVGGVTTAVPASWTEYWDLCYTNPDCSIGSDIKWAAEAGCTNNSLCFYQSRNTHFMGTDVPSATTHVVVGKHRIQPFGTAEQIQYDLIYERVQTGDAPAPDPLNPTQDLTVQRPYPAFVFPPKGGEVPIAGAMRFAVPSPAFGDPYTQPGDPYGAPYNEPPPPWRSPDAPTRPVVVPVFTVPLALFPWPRTQLQPTPQPETQVIVVPDAGTMGPPGPPAPPTVGYAIPPRPRNARPGGRRKEVKVRMMVVGRIAWGIVNFITESIDFLDAIHGALPYKLQAKPTKGHKPTPTEKAEKVWRHLDELDMAKAVENFVNNQVEDWLYGRMDQSKNLNQLTGAPTGAGAALDGNWRPGLYDLGEPVALSPEVHFDPDTGEWELDTPFGSMRGNLGDRFGR